MKAKAYHHGDLRAALIRIGLEHLARGPASALSLREIARDAGVSATAVYRHFPDKQALESALAKEGGEELGKAQALAQAKVESRAAKLIASGRAYVRFALANPSLFRLMTTMMAVREDPFAREGDQQSPGLRLLQENISALAGEGAGSAERRVRAIRAWAIVHGLAMLMLDGQIPAEDALIDQAINESVLL